MLRLGRGKLAPLMVILVLVVSACGTTAETTVDGNDALEAQEPAENPAADPEVDVANGEDEGSSQDSDSSEPAVPVEETEPAEPAEAPATAEPAAPVEETEPAEPAEEPASAETTACEANLAAFATQPQLNARCDGDWLLLDGTGLAQVDADQPAMMVGITSWILRVPLPFQYDWRIPSVPEWLDGTIQASPRGPIAVAIDGVPIFHYEARPDGSTALADYSARSDTVVAGELDHCGGHAGQGEDYHYHYAPVCLIDGHDPSEPIAFGLDGAPVFIGTAGDDYYGLGQHNDIDLTPDEPLNDCNAIQLDDGSWVHYTTREPPYLIGCHHGAVDSSLQIEPAPMREQRVAAPYGGLVGEPMQTLVTDWYVDDDGWMHLEHESFDGNGTSAIVYRQTDGDDCWDFDFREDANTAGVLETYCRPTR